MATTSRMNNASVLNQPHKAYVTTGAFASAIFSYAVTTSFTGGQFLTNGTLTAFGVGTGNNQVPSDYNVAGAILRENGKKLIPGVNPLPNGNTTYYVGVYHPVFGSGYINPNGPLFALYNSDKSNYLYNGTDLLENDLGPPVVTAGSVTATGGLSGASLALPATGTAATVGTATLVTGTFTVLTSAVTGNSKIFLTYSGTVYTNPGILRVGTITGGTSFVINSSSVTDISTVNWLIIN